MFYDVFEELCQKKGVTPKTATRELGLSNSTASKWKKTGATPRGETLKKVAAYFGVTESYLLRDEKNQPTADYDDELIEELQILRDNPDTRTLLYAGKHLKPEQIKQFADLMKSMTEG